MGTDYLRPKFEYCLMDEIESEINSTETS